MNTTVQRTPRSGRQSLFFQDLASPISARKGKFSSPGQAAAVSALWRENFAGSDLPPPPVYTLEDRSDFSPESGILDYPMSPEVKSDPRTPLQSSVQNFQTLGKNKSETSTSHALMGPQQNQQGSAGFSWWSPAKSGSEQDDKGKGSPVEGVVQPGALITLPPPREVARPEIQRNSVPVGNLNEEEWVTIYGFPPADTNLVLREFEKCGVILKHIPGPRDANWMHILYQNRFDAQKALSKNGMQINGVLIVGVKTLDPMQRRTLDEKLSNQGFMTLRFTNVYVKNLPEKTTDEDLKKLFGTYGTITSAVVMTDSNGKSRCFGFVNFQSPDAAAAAVDKLNGVAAIDDKVLFVGRAQSKAEREAELKAKFEQERISRYEKLQGANLYLKNLDDSINDDKLKELFSEFGTITSCKIMLGPQGQSKGSGFVAFSTPEEATKALDEMNGKMIGRKPLYVAVAQRKEDRKARLQAHFSQIQAHGGMAPLPSGIPGFHPGAPRFASQQLYFGQGNPGLIPPQPAGYGFQQQLLPGMRPGVSPNFIMPYHLQRQGQPGQRMGVRRGGNLLPQQLMHRNSHQGPRYMGNSRNGMDTSVVPQGVVGPVMPVPFDGSGMPVTSIDIQRPGRVHISALLSALASATPENQRAMLGEQLYPHVEKLESNNASKVTGMLLEMDQSEVIHLLESPDALKQKVAEAMEVLRKAASESGVSDQLGSLAE